MPGKSEAQMSGTGAVLGLEMNLRSIVQNFALCLIGFRSVKQRELTTFSKNCNGYFLRVNKLPSPRINSKRRNVIQFSETV